MHKKKLIQLLKNMEKEELSRCRKYLLAILKEKGDEAKLFKYIWPSRKDWAANRLNLEKTRRKLKPELGEKSFLNIMSNLTKRIEDFLVIREMASTEKKMDRLLVLAEIYRRKGLYDYFKEVHREMRELTEEITPLDLTYQMKLMLKDHQLFFSQFLSDEERLAALKSVYFRLEKLYEERKLFYEIEGNNQKNLFSKSNLFTDKIKQNTLLNILKKLEKLVDSKDIQSFSYLDNLLQTNHQSLSKELAEVILLHLINACIHLIRFGHIKYKQKMNELYDWGLETGILLYSGKLSETAFLNMIDVKTKITPKPDIPHFIEKNISLVQTKNPTSLKNMAYAMDHFAKGTYYEAINYLNSDTVLNTLDWSYRARLIRICSLYSVNVNKIYEEKNQVLESARKFFERTKLNLSPSHYIGAINLLNLIKMIWDKQPYSKVIAFREQAKPLAFSFWVNKTLENYS